MDGKIGIVNKKYELSGLLSEVTGRGLGGSARKM
jgi:hypothetical protein